jgi:hypothetical protein
VRDIERDQKVRVALMGHIERASSAWALWRRLIWRYGTCTRKRRSSICPAGWHHSCCGAVLRARATTNVETALAAVMAYAPSKVERDKTS